MRLAGGHVISIDTYTAYIVRRRFIDKVKQTLLTHGMIDNLIQVDLGKRPDKLQQFIYSFPLPVEKHHRGLTVKLLSL